MNLEIRHVRQALALAEHGSFQRAARALGLSQPALSRSLQALERKLGAKLFERGGPGGVQPTELGRVLLDRGEGLLEDHGEILRELRLLLGLETGHLSVSAGFYPASVSVYRAAGRLLRQHPHVHFELRVSTWRRSIDDVLARTVDVAVADLRVAAQDAQFEIQPLANHPIAFVCRKGHPILRAAEVTPEVLFGYPIMGTRAPAQMARQFPAPPYAAGRIDPASGDFIPAVLAHDVAAGLDVVRASDTLGALVSPGTTGLPVPPGLKLVPFDAPWMRLDYGFITLRGRTPSPATQAFMAEVRAVEEGLPR